MMIQLQNFSLTSYKDTFEGEFTVWSDDPLFFNGQEPIPVLEEISFVGQRSVSVMLRKGFRASANVVGAPFYIENGNWYYRDSSDKSEPHSFINRGKNLKKIVAGAFGIRLIWNLPKHQTLQPKSHLQ